MRLSRPRGLLARLAVRTAVVGFLFFVVAGGAVVAVAGRTAAGQVEERLRSVAADLVSSPLSASDGEELCALVGSDLPGSWQSEGAVVIELRGPVGQVCRPPGAVALEAAATPPAVVRWFTGTDLQTVLSEDGDPTLVLDQPLENGWTARVGGDLTDFELLARRLVTTMLVLSVPGALVAAVAGYYLTRSGLRPVRDLAETAETVARTQDLSVAVEVPDSPPDDEVARLAVAFNAMVAALARARERHNRLILDAGHELRTPLTSLGTNLDLLVRSERAGRPLPPDDRAALLTDVRGQLDELAALVSALLVLAHEGPSATGTDVRWDEVVDRAVDRARRRADGHVIEVALEPWVVPDADADALERVAVNLLDNALKFSPPGSTVRVRVRSGRLEVQDDGPGVGDRDREHVFERFWRSEEARALPGTGLGLAIVADTAGAHCGTVRLDPGPGGGTVAVLSLPGRAPG